MKIRKILYIDMLLVAAMFLLPMAVLGQNLPGKGTWDKTTITNNQTVDLTGDVTISGMIAISNGGSLTITNSTAGEVKISRSNDTVMFRVDNGGSLKITGKEGGVIVVDGGANFVWDEAGWNNRKGMSWNECGYGKVGYTPLKTNTASMSTSMIESNGELSFEYTRIQQFNGGNNTISALYIAKGYNPKCGRTNLKNCEITLCSSEEGSAIFVGGQNGVPENTNENCAVTLEKVTISRCVINPIHEAGTEEGNAWGGVIRFRGSSVCDLIMTGCTMKQNYSSGDGSCLWWNAAGSKTTPSTLVMNGCTFDDNRADRDAGAVRLESGFKFEGSPTLFKNNSCGRYGGAIQVADYNAGAVQTVNFSYDLNDLLEVNNNYAHVGGGGIAFYYVTNELNRETTFNINLAGLKVNENRAGERGGGILFTDLRPNSEGIYNFNIYLNKGAISNNSAVKGGGGIFARKMTILTNTGSEDKIKISNNKVTAAEGVAGEEGTKGGGGGISLYDGSMTLNTCEITGNIVTGANGKTDLTNGYGGGIMLNRSTFTLDGNNNISGNRANVGGGVAALNETETPHTVSLTSGNINGNTANLCGGGVAIIGNVKMTVNGVNIKENEALNAGGIYMRGRTTDNSVIAGANATLTYTGGQITGNKAKATLKEGETVTPLANTTAYQATTDKITGMGGGICVGGNSTLELLIKEHESLGIQGNLADNGADDLFCNGTSGTKVVLPNVSQMVIENVDRLFWVEDYITNDTQYKQGTNVNTSWNSDNIRFRDAQNTNRMDQVFRLSESPNYSFSNSYNGSESIYEVFDNKYMCLTLGSVMSYIVLNKTGMSERDNAIFKIYRWKLEGRDETPPADLETNKEYFYRKVILTDQDKFGNRRRKMIQAPLGYYYYIVELPWSWAYDSQCDPTNGVRKIDREAISEASRTFTFTNAPKDDTPRHAESVKVNVMPGK